MCVSVHVCLCVYVCLCVCVCMCVCAHTHTHTRTHKNTERAAHPTVTTRHNTKNKNNDINDNKDNKDNNNFKKKNTCVNGAADFRRGDEGAELGSSLTKFSFSLV